MDCVVCDKFIDHREYNWLADTIPGCCKECAQAVWERRQEKFRQHLDDASAIVATWPEWKRRVLR